MIIKRVLFGCRIMQSVRNYSSSFNVSMKILIFIVSCFINILLQSKQNHGFSTEFIHINSPLSPFFDPNLTDQGYIEQIGSSSLINGGSLYLMKISYGTPQVELYHIVDTGSELSWIQCLPCVHCYQSESAPFNPNASSTFKFEKSSAPGKRWVYKLTYHDKSHSEGDVAKETITIGFGSNKREFKDFLFGCGHDNDGTFPRKAAGVVGFNRKKYSFISQLRNEHHGAFSYCMAPRGSTRPGRISFGYEAIVSDNNVMTTPLIPGFDYKIELTDISVGEKKLKYIPDSYLASNDSKEKNFKLQLSVDSGSSVILLSNSFYSLVEKEIKDHIKGILPIGKLGGYNLCYSSSLTDANIPKIKLHFPGVVLELSPFNAFISIKNTHRCLAIWPHNTTYILGNNAQTNFLVGFNLVENKLLFKPTDCAAL